MNKKSGKKVNRKKAIPVYFQRSQASISQILTTANYKRRVKDLMRINKELACTLQDVRCRVADQERALAEYNRKTTQMMFVKMKIKDMASTVQKLVSDMEEVKNCMDSNSNCFLHSGLPHEEVRLKITDPGMSIIEESASRSALEADLSREESSSCRNVFGPVSTEAVSEIHTSLAMDTSRTEIYSIPAPEESKTPDCSNKSQDGVARASKSAEHIEPLGSPGTPEPPPSPSFFNLKAFTQSQTLLGLRKLCSSKSSPTFSQNTEKTNVQTTKNSTSKIPTRKPTPVVVNVCPQPPVSSNHSNRRETFVIERVQNEPQTVLSSADRRGTFTLNTFPASDHLNDRRATFVVPALPADKPASSPPKVTEPNPPFQAAVPNETVLLCEDMELTEIIPVQNQAQQFIPSQEVLIEEMEAEERLSNNELPTSASISAFASNPIENLPVGVNSVKPNASLQPAIPSPVFTILPILAKDKQITSSVMVNESSDKRKNAASVDPLVKTRLSRSQARKNMESVDVVPNKNPSPKEKDIETSIAKSSAIGKDITPVAASKNISTTDVLAQPTISHLLPKEITDAVEAVEESDSRMSTTSKSSSAKSKTLEDIPKSEGTNALIKEKSRFSHLTKKRSASKGQSSRSSDAKVKRASSKDQSKTSSSSQPNSAKIPETESSGSSSETRRSARKLSSHYENFFESDPNESDVDPSEDFLRKRFSIAAGRRIINPNNNKVFVFKNYSKQYSSDERNSVAAMADKSPGIEGDNSIESDVFNFSASSEADKSPAKKPKKSRKSILRKSRKPSTKKQSFIKNKLSKENTTPVALHEKDVPILRKSILASSKDTEVLLSSRKSVRFTLTENAELTESYSPPFEIKIIENKPGNESKMNEECLSRSSRNSTGKKIPFVKKIYSSAKRSSLKATGDKLSHSGTKLKSEKGKQRRSPNLNSNTLVDIFGLSKNPNEKEQQVIDETDRQLETLPCLSSARKMESNSTKSSPKNENSLNKRGKKDSNEVALESEINLVAIDEIIRSSKGSEAKGSVKGKRTFSGVSERRSKKRSTIDHDFLADLDNSLLSCKSLSKGADAPIMDSEPTEACHEKDPTKPISPVSNCKQTTSERKKKISKQGKNSNLKAENSKIKNTDSTVEDTVASKKILALHNKDHKSGAITKSNLKLDVLVHSDTLKSQKLKRLPSADSIHPDEIGNVQVQMAKLDIKSKPKKPRKKTTKENVAVNSLDIKVDGNCDAINMQPIVALELLPLQHQCGSELLCFTSPKASDDMDGGRPRRSRPVKSLKEPSLNKKMRR